VVKHRCKAAPQGAQTPCVANQTNLLGQLNPQAGHSWVSFPSVRKLLQFGWAVGRALNQVVLVGLSPRPTCCAAPAHGTWPSVLSRISATYIYRVDICIRLESNLSLPFAWVLRLTQPFGSQVLPGCLAHLPASSTAVCSVCWPGSLCTRGPASASRQHILACARVCLGLFVAACVSATQQVWSSGVSICGLKRLGIRVVVCCYLLCCVLHA
jgi:hypothetical protein